MIETNEDEFVKLKMEDVTATTTFPSLPVENTVQEDIVPSGSRNLSTNAEIGESNDSGKTDIKIAEVQPHVETENIASRDFCKPNKSQNNVVAKSETPKDMSQKSPLNETPLVVPSKVHKLNLPDNYKGSQMFMPTGEQIFWLGETHPSASDTASYQDFKEIRSQCLADGKLFEDPEFPAVDYSLYNKQESDKRLKWLRPKEICENPQLFVEGYSRFDVQQGELGDCWLLAAVSTLTLHRNLFYQVVPNDQSFDEDYAGIFHFRFWQYGRWVDVVVDDRLPTYRGNLHYLHSSERNEFWGALLEKAYAKLHGSYDALRGGFTCEAMVDFTGGVTESYQMTSLPDNFFTILLKAYERNSLLCCMIDPDPNVLEAETPAGLIRGHAYSVTRVKYVDIETPGRAGKIPLLRLRNPWGNEAEWNGAWSDKSPEWQFIPQSEREELGLTFSDDGEFWMSFEDFVSHFNRVEMCNLNPDSFNIKECHEGCTKKWEMSVFEGKWMKDISAGGCVNYSDTFWKNPHYTVTLKDPDEDDEENKCTIIVSLMQKNCYYRSQRGLSLLPIGFAVFRLPEHHDVQKPFECNSNDCVGHTNYFTNQREVWQRYQLTPGSYLIVPSTFMPNEEGEFLLRVFSEKSNNMTENDEDVFMSDLDDRIKKLALNPEPADPIRALFNILAGADGEVDWRELKEILDYAMREEIAMRHAVDAGGVDQQEQNCLKQLLCTLCTNIYRKIRIDKLRDLMQEQQEPGTWQQEQVLLDQPQLRVCVSNVAELQGEGFSENVCKRMIEMLDKDASGSLGFKEFKSLWIDLRQWRAVFRLYDTEGHGAVPLKHLRDALHSAGYTINAHTVNELAQRYSSCHGIQFAEFILCLVRLKTKIGNTA
ncbi:calpain-A-like [Vanessa cardui]|uniref:calpain-A-like n=1 Tax=Vanessa cardui TaxID=171605 RepID=UPI001F12D04A|nr:calpain-A-like [Vanessa cardui]